MLMNPGPETSTFSIISHFSKHSTTFLATALGDTFSPEIKLINLLLKY